MKNEDRFNDSTVREPVEGFKDIYGQSARLRNMVANKIAESFQMWGYDQIISPIVERASSFSEQVVGGSPWPEWNKRSVFYLHVQNYQNNYTDLPEQIPALLIPEGTISVSRWLAKQLVIHEKETLFPKKVFYITPCFRNEVINKLTTTKCREFSQVGVEILGTSNILSDIETLFLINEGFKALEIPTSKMLIRLGNVEIFTKLCDESNIDATTRLILKDKMDTIAESRAGKQPERLEPELKLAWEALEKLNLPEKLVHKWKIIFSTFTQTVDDKTKAILNYGESVDNLNFVADVLRLRGINCVIDFTVVRSHEYYTGIVYEIDLKDNDGNVYVEVAGGGRYNKLITKFLAKKDYTIPAVGFAYGLERIVDYFNMINTKKVFSVNYWTDKNDVDIVVNPKNLKTPPEIHQMFLHTDDLRKQGSRVDVFVGDGSDIEVEKYAAQLSAILEKTS